MSGGPLEKDTCRDYVLPRLIAAGWAGDQIVEQFPITDGRIITVGKKHRRGESLRADYVLEYEPSVPIAVVEAKREYSIPGKGLQQAKRYAQLLDLPFAYSSNGRGIVEDDRGTGLETDKLNAFPSPEALWMRYIALGKASAKTRSPRDCCFRSTERCATPTAASRRPGTTSGRRSIGRSRRSCAATNVYC